MDCWKYDKYYTKSEIEKDCLSQIKDHLQIQSDDLTIEPSAGNGAWIKAIQELKYQSMFYDLNPEHPEIIQQDFLKLDLSSHVKEFRRIHVIGNPPFGRQSSMEIKFIKKYESFADNISFILPRSFKKCSIRSKINMVFHLIYEKDLPKSRL